MNMFVGTNQVQAVIWVDGSGTADTLWVMPVITVNSDIDDGLLSEVAAWIDEIPIVGAFIGAGIAFLGQLIQFLIPDGIAAVLGTVTSVMRSEGTTSTDDNFVEVVVGSIGYKGLITDVLAHYPGDGSGSQGIGFRLVDSTLAIVLRSNPLGLGASTSAVTGAGLYQIGDVLRFQTYADLHFHTLSRNGKVVGIYDDLGTLTIGAGYRTVALSMQAEISTIGGARSDSAKFVSLVAGDLQTNFSLASGGGGGAGGADAPTTVGGDDPYNFTDVSADPGGAGASGGAHHPWVTITPAWIADL